MKRRRTMPVGLVVTWFIVGAAFSSHTTSGQELGTDSNAEHETESGGVESAEVPRAADLTNEEVAAPVRQLTPSDGEWQREYGMLNELIERFDEGVQLFHKDVQSFIDQKYKDELKRIQQTYDTRYEKLDEEVRVRREQAIAAFERFIQKYPESGQTPLAMFRLAELYYDQASDEFIDAQEELDKLLAELDPSEPVEVEDPKYDFGKSLAMYDRIQREFLTFKHIDGVYYMRGWIYGNPSAIQYAPEIAKDLWLALIQEHPESSYSSQALVRIGNYYFELNTDVSLRTAIEYYEKVMSYRDNRYDRALYKLAWAYYKLSDYDNAATRFIELIDFSQRLYEKSGRISDLRVEAVEYLAISFSDSGDVYDALEFFEKIGDRPYKLEILKKLADVYYRQAKYEQSIEAYTVLQQEFPNNEENPAFQNEIVKILQLPPPNIDRANEAAAVLIEKYSPDTDWWNQQGQNRAAMAKAQQLSEERLRDLAFFYHNEAIEADSSAEERRYYERAAQKYREYIDRFPYSDKAYELQYFFADCLFFSQHYEEAAEQYRIAMASTNPQYHSDAAKGIVYSYMELMSLSGLEGVLIPYPVTGEGGGSDEGATGPKGPQPIPLSPLRKKYVKSVDVLATINPDDENTAKQRFIAAQIFFYHHQYDKAEQRYLAFITRYPNNEFADEAAANLVDGLRAQKKWMDVMDAIDRLAVLELGNDSRDWNRVRSELLALRVQAHRKHAEELAFREEKLEAVAEFEKIGKDVDLFNAAKILEQLGKVDRAIEDYKALTRQYPRSEYVEESLFRIASNYEKFFDLPQAIEYYELLSKNYPRSKYAEDSILNAAFLRIGLHQYQESARAYERFAKVYSENPDAEPTLFFAGENYLKANDCGEAVRTFREYLRRYYKVHGDRSLQAHHAIITCLEDMGRVKESRELEKRTPNMVAALKELDTFTANGLGLYGEILFKDMQRTMDEFMAGKFTGNARAQARMLDTKLQLVNSLETKMVEIIRIGDAEWASAAVYTVGHAYHAFADDLRDAVPDGLSLEDEEIYMLALEEEFIQPFEEQALHYYRSTLELEEKKKIWNSWIEKTYSRLNELRPDIYPARKKEKTMFAGEEQKTMAPPILTIPLADASAQRL